MTEEKKESQEKIENTDKNFTNQEQAPEIKSEENKENWKKFREEREKDRKARQEAEELAKKKAQEAEALKAAMDALLSKEAPKSSSGSEYDDYEDNEARTKRMIQEALEADRKQRDQERQQYEQQHFPEKLRSSYSDFNQVCTAENLDYFEYKYPSLARTLGSQPDSYAKWEAIYEAIKPLIPEKERFSEQQRIDKNLSKPQSYTADMSEKKGLSPHFLTEQRKRENWARMQKDMKSFG